MTASDNEWQRVVQRTTSGATSDNESSFQLIFLFFEEERNLTTKDSKENALNLEEELLH